MGDLSICKLGKLADISYSLGFKAGYQYVKPEDNNITPGK